MVKFVKNGSESYIPDVRFYSLVIQYILDKSYFTFLFPFRL